MNKAEYITGIESGPVVSSILEKTSLQVLRNAINQAIDVEQLGTDKEKRLNFHFEDGSIFTLI